MVWDVKAKRKTDDRRKALKKPGACLSGPTTRNPQTAFPSEAPQNPSSSEKYSTWTKNTQNRKLRVERQGFEKPMRM